jgi:hypothetical protein
MSPLSGTEDVTQITLLLSLKNTKQHHINGLEDVHCVLGESDDKHMCLTEVPAFRRRRDLRTCPSAARLLDDQTLL